MTRLTFYAPGRLYKSRRSANATGCEPFWRSFACCVESVPMCSALRGFDRASCAANCPMLFEPYTMCIESMGRVACFMRAWSNCNLR